jgi:hypothetical protein
MKRKAIIFFLLVSVIGAVYAQRIPSVGVVVFDLGGGSVTTTDAINMTNQVIAELSSWGTLNIIRGAEGAEYVIQGTLSRQAMNYVISASTTNAGNQQVLNVFTEQASTLNGISILSFCAKAVERVPLPNYLLGTWQSTITMPDGPVVCIIEFRTDRSARVERYDTWEHRQMNALRYEGYGTGSYSYAGFANRIVTIRSQQVRIDATIGVNLRLEETLPEQTAVNQGGLHIIFNSDKTAFDILNGTLPCGRNYDGPSIHPSTSLGFSSFIKIR